jgi:hypothetical protein
MVVDDSQDVVRWSKTRTRTRRPKWIPAISCTNYPTGPGTSRASLHGYLETMVCHGGLRVVKSHTIESLGMAYCCLCGCGCDGSTRNEHTAWPTRSHGSRMLPRNTEGTPRWRNIVVGCRSSSSYLEDDDENPSFCCCCCFDLGRTRRNCVPLVSTSKRRCCSQDASIEVKDKMKFGDPVVQRIMLFVICALQDSFVSKLKKGHVCRFM